MAKREHLLVIDWDFFFPNPWEGAANPHEHALELFDWGHKEAPFFIEPQLWNIRAAGFVRNEYPLPDVTDEWRDFAGRFKISPEARIIACDSNAVAGLQYTRANKPYESVWLYDAHHDCGYDGLSYPEWLAHVIDKERIEFDCGNWMRLHKMRGSKLYYRRPTWQDEIQSAIPKGTGLDVEQDDGSSPAPTFTDVLICRSGAWTPTWCDGKFAEFVATWKGEHIVAEGEPLVRVFDMADVQAEIDHRAEADALLKEMATRG